MTCNPQFSPRRLRLATAVFAATAMLAGCSGTPQQREVAHLRRGNEYLKEKNYKKAVIEFKVASQNMPKDPEPPYLLGMTYLSGGAAKPAFESFQKAISLNPRHGGAGYQLALFKLNPKLILEAKQVISDWAAHHPNDADAFASLGLAEVKLGNTAEARRWLEIGASKNVSSFRIVAAALAIYAAKGDVESAKELSRSLAERLPRSPEAAILRAQVSLGAKDLADADAQISRALSLQRDFRPALQLRLRREMMTGDVVDAEQTTKELAQLPEKRMWGAYARLLFAQNKPDKGIAEFERAVKDHNNDTQLRDDYANTLLAAKLSSQAGTVATGTLAVNPKDVPALMVRIIVEIDRGSLEAAARDVRAMQDLKALSPQLSFQEARIFAARGETVREGDLLTEALKRDGRFLAARLELVRLLIAARKSRNALTILDLAPPAQKRNIEFVFARNMALLSSGDWEEARTGVNAAMAVVRSPGFLYQDALLRIHDRDMPGARKSLETAFQLAPADPATLNLLGDLMRQQGEFLKYIAMVRDAAASNRGSAVLQNAFGNLLVRQGDDIGARGAFEAAKAAGDRINPEIDIALLDLRSGSVDKARDRLLNLVKDHDNARAQVTLAEIEMRAGVDRSPVQHYLKAIQLEPTNVLAMNNLAAYLATRQKKYDDALFWGQKALAAAPNSPIVEDTIGWTYYLEGRYDLALPYLDKSVRSGDRALAHYHLAADLLKIGDTARGRREYETGLKGDPKSPERPAVEALLAAGRK